MSSGTFEARLKTAERICISRAGAGNAASTRELCNCIEQPDGEKLMAELVRRSHGNARLRAGVSLLFDVASINACAAKFGVDPLALPVGRDATNQSGNALEFPEVASFRAECDHDVDLLLQELQSKFNGAFAVRERAVILSPDVKVELGLRSPLTFTALQQAMQGVPDSHVMLRTLRAIALAENSLEQCGVAESASHEDDFAPPRQR